MLKDLSAAAALIVFGVGLHHWLAALEAML